MKALTSISMSCWSTQVGLATAVHRLAALMDSLATPTFRDRYGIRYELASSIRS